MEEVALPERCDVLVSEPMGTLLVNERMLETYLFARDHLLKPGGRMFPVRAWLAPFVLSPMWTLCSMVVPGKLTHHTDLPSPL